MMRPLYLTCHVEGCDRQACHECTQCIGIFCDKHGDYWPYYRIYPYDDWRCRTCLEASYTSLGGGGETYASDQSPAPEFLAARIHSSKGSRSDAEVLDLLDYRDEESAIVEYPSTAEDSSGDGWDFDYGTSNSFTGDEESPWVTGEYVSFYAREAELEDDPDEPDYRDDVYFDGPEDFEAETYCDNEPDEEDNP